MTKELAELNNTSESLSLQEKDKKYLWHPFTQMQDWQQEDIVVIKSAEGVYLEDTEGKRYLDGVSSLWCNVHGHRVHELDEAVRSQLDEVAHSTFLGLSNVPGIELAEKLIAIAPRGLSRVFYSDSGSEAIEIGLKMAYQYWDQKGFSEKKKFISFKEAYHGDTIGSVSVGGIDLFHRIFKNLLFETLSVPTPYVYRMEKELTEAEVKEYVLKEIENKLRQHQDEVAAIVMEPLMQGAAGMIKHPAGLLAGVRELANRYDVLLIVDEVATGFGRTGKMFACEHENVTPDIMAVAKGLTGGYLPLAATLTTEKVYQGFLGKYENFKTFFHGHTYTANPLACRVAIANLDYFEDKAVIEGLSSKIDLITNKLEAFRDLPCVGDIRQLGLMVGIELVQDRKTKEPFDPSVKIGARVIERARELGAIIRPLGGVIVLMPPLAMTEEQLTELIEITYQSIKEVTEKSVDN